MTDTCFSSPYKPQTMQARQRPTDEAQAAVQQASRRALSVLALVVTTLCTWPGSQALAVAPPDTGRSVPATVVPGTGIATPAVVPSARPTPPAPTGVGSLSGPGPGEGACAALRKRYAQSQACFARYRLKNHRLSPMAARRCKQMTDPSGTCAAVRP